MSCWLNDNEKLPMLNNVFNLQHCNNPFHHSCILTLTSYICFNVRVKAFEFNCCINNRGSILPLIQTQCVAENSFTILHTNIFIFIYFFHRPANQNDDIALHIYCV